MTLQEGLSWLLGGGAGVVAYYILAQLDADWPWFHTLRSDYKRYLSFVLTGVFASAIAAVAMLASIAMGYAQPLAWRPWIEMLFPVVFSAIVLAQTWHAKEVLRYREPEVPAEPEWQGWDCDRR